MIGSQPRTPLTPSQDRRNCLKARKLTVRIDAQSKLAEGEVCKAIGVCHRRLHAVCKKPTRLRSLVWGVYEKGKLVYAGRVGTGFTFKPRSDLKKQLDKAFASDVAARSRAERLGLRQIHRAENDRGDRLHRMNF